jgi:hypothetical protein
MNLAKKRLSFRVRFAEYDLDVYRNPIDEVISHPIIFLPPPSEVSVDEAINYLLKKEKGIIETKESELPKWAENIKIFDEGTIRNKIKELKELKAKTEKELKEYNSKLIDLIKFKRLLTTDGLELENMVEDAFKLLGIKTKRGPKGKEDRIVIDPTTKSEIPIEITGVKHSIPESKLNQLIGRLSDEERIKKIKCKCKGILVGNHYKEEPLSSNLQGRKKPFEPEVIKKAEISKISLLSTLELFKVVNAKLEKKNIHTFVHEIFNTPGELIFKE